jgi:hypothetical protein
MGGVGHVRKGEDQRTPNGQSEAQIAFSIDWGVARPSQSPPQAKTLASHGLEELFLQ